MFRHPTTDPAPPAAVPKKRGNYYCGRCGLPKKGHVCSFADSSPAAILPRSRHRLRRALSFHEDRASTAPDSTAEDEAVAEMEAPEAVLDAVEEDGDKVDSAGEGMILPMSCMVEVLRRLSPKELIRSAAFCQGWRGCVRRVWRSAEELRLTVLPQSQIGFVGSVLHKCAGLTRLTLRMESDVVATMLACISFSLHNLEALEINMVEKPINNIIGDELGRFVAEKKCLTTLKVEGCSNIGSLNISSSSLSTLCLSSLYCISKVVLKCPNLTEISLDFTRQKNDSTDLVTLMGCLGYTCPRLKNIHMASVWLCNEVVLALTNAAVTAIVSCYTSLELLDLSGSSITDSGIRMICNVFPETLSTLLIAVCPNITCSGIQFAAAQLPFLVLIDCGMSIFDENYYYESTEEKMCHNVEEHGENIGRLKLSTTGTQKMYQKLIIKHTNIKKLSLWGCSGLDALYINCPELIDVNLNSCTNLHPERLLLRCPNLKNIHATGCQEMLIGAIRNQVLSEFKAVEDHLPCKRLADGSKRVQVPHFVQQLSADEKQKGKRSTQYFVYRN